MKKRDEVIETPLVPTCHVRPFLLYVNRKSCWAVTQSDVVLALDPVFVSLDRDECSGPALDEC